MREEREKAFPPAGNKKEKLEEQDDQ